MKKILPLLAFASFACQAMLTTANACTHVTLKGTDGTIVSGRTLEWESFDLHMNLNIIPRNSELKFFPMPDNVI